MTTWQTDPNTGLTTVDFGNGPQVPVITDPKLLSTLQNKVVGQWSDLIAKYAAASGVPFAPIAGTILQESGGNPNALNPGDTPHGAGLMQITSAVLRKGHTDQELFDPDLNLSIGVPYFTNGWNKYNQDLPSAAAAFNAGAARNCGPSQVSCCHGTTVCSFCQCNEDYADSKYPSGINATKGYIGNVVKATNTVVMNGWVPEGSSPTPVPPLQANISGSNPGTNMLWFFVAGLGGYFLIKRGVPMLKKKRR